MESTARKSHFRASQVYLHRLNVSRVSRLTLTRGVQLLRLECINILDNWFDLKRPVSLAREMSRSKHQKTAFGRTWSQT